MYTEKDLILFNWRLFFLASTTQFLIAYGIHIVSDQKADGRKEARFFLCNNSLDTSPQAEILWIQLDVAFISSKQVAEICRIKLHWLACLELTRFNQIPIPEVRGV